MPYQRGRHGSRYGPAPVAADSTDASRGRKRPSTLLNAPPRNTYGPSRSMAFTARSGLGAQPVTAAGEVSVNAATFARPAPAIDVKTPPA